MACNPVGKEYMKYQITRFSDYSDYLANKSAYDHYNKAAKWYEDNKDVTVTSAINTNIEEHIKNIYMALALKKKFPMAHILIGKLKEKHTNSPNCKTLKSDAEKNVCKC